MSGGGQIVPLHGLLQPQILFISTLSIHLTSFFSPNFKYSETDAHQEQ